MKYFTKLICISDIIKNKFKSRFKKCKNLRQSVLRIMNLYILEKYSNIFEMGSNEVFIEKMDLVK